ncbi:SEC14-like protein 2 isoform X3 [Stegodyphus dumicola]|uniref:SEC14-like protein 2 isoform X3 n=1 Tax=Stegodyphus dumicola TaxID=202533 RepID=UPI0015B19A5D|nr:SEC14-like protein 2 isoform X3 [Stegodyphus dumicola]
MYLTQRRWSDIPMGNNKYISSIELGLMNGTFDYKQQEDQRIALKEFRRAVQDILQHHHDDQFLLRWLKARDFDLAKAERMIRESFKFRKKLGADTILTSAYELPEVYKKHPITECLGFDKEHSVVRLFMAGICDYKGFVYSLRIVDMMKILIYMLEHDLKMVQEKKKKIVKLEEKTTFILDFNGFTLKQFYDKSVINAGIQLITMYQDNYPETLKAAYLINVPSYFSWIFNLFKPFLNAVTLSKIKIYRTDEWQDELFQIMDPKLVPAFMGGKLTDPDGNPKCTTLINWNSKIPPSFYLKQSQQNGGADDPSMKSVTVQQRSTFEVPVEVKVSGTILKWVFKTKEYNIRFGLFFKPNGKKSHTEEIIPIGSVDCQVLPEENELICEKEGTYILHFDNSYSWLTAKQLMYKVETEAPDANETNNN